MIRPGTGRSRRTFKAPLENAAGCFFSRNSPPKIRMGVDGFMYGPVLKMRRVIGGIRRPYFTWVKAKDKDGKPIRAPRSPLSRRRRPL